MPITWFVNLPADARHHRGPAIPLKVTRGLLTSYKATRSVTWTCTPANNNFNTVAADASFTLGAQPNTQQSSTNETLGKNNKASRSFHNRLELPPYGGDSYKVTARRSDKTGNSLDKTFTIKRRIYYIFNYMNSEGVALYNDLRSDLERIFADVGIELKQVSKQKIPNRAIIANLEPLVKKRPAIPSKYKGLILRLGLINQSATTVDHSVDLPLVNGHGNGLGGDRVVKQNGVWKLTIKLPPQVGVPAHRRLRLPPQVTAKVELTSYYKYSYEVRNEWFSKGCQDLPHSVRRIDDRTAELTLSGGDNAVLDRLAQAHANHHADEQLNAQLFSQLPAHDHLRLTVKLDTLRPIGGLSSGANIALTQDMSVFYPNGTRQQKARALARVFAHEIAHSIGMVPTSMTYNGANHVHANHYTDDHGGTGHHCHYHATLVNNTALAAGEFYDPTNLNCLQIYTPDDHTACIMFHQRTNHLHRMEFCAVCKAFMRAQDLSKDNLKDLDNVKSWDQVF